MIKELIYTLIIFFVANISLAQENHIRISGIYPHLSVFNDKHNSEHPGETGIGAVVPWANKLWAITYSAHKPLGSADKLYEINRDLALTIRPESVGGTHANRMIHKESDQLIIGPYFIDKKGHVRAIAPAIMAGRLTAVTRHLYDPENKVYFYTMEEGLYEVNVHTLEVYEINKDGNVLVPRNISGTLVPGYHGKGAYTSQDRLVVANNGEYNWLETDLSGCLAEWDGNKWHIIEKKQFTDVTGPGDIFGDIDGRDPLWAIGWDENSLILKLLDKGKWSDFRLPKASFSYDGKHGWHTEWPRIRKVDQRRLMTMHGMFWEFPATFSAENTAGIRPLSSYQKIVSDFCDWNDQIVMACDDASLFDNRFVGQPQSNFWFTTAEHLKRLGPRSGYGNIWSNDSLDKASISDPFLINGFNCKVVHINHTSGYPVTFSIEVDKAGKNYWEKIASLSIPSGEYNYILLNELNGQWIRIITDKSSKGTTVSVHLTSKGSNWNIPQLKLFKSLANTDDISGFNFGLLRPAEKNRNLSYYMLDSPEQLWEINENMQFARVVNDQDSLYLKENINLDKRDFEVDEASVIVTDSHGNRFRLPKNDEVYEHPLNGLWPRGIREAVTERSLFNCYGTFYELPRDISGGFERIKPITTHNQLIMDFCSWRGLLVLSGTKKKAHPDGQYFASAEGETGLWFGNIDDLWKFGKPVGQGGPWYQTSVGKGQLSDPYLMTGYDQKLMEINTDVDATFIVEVNFDFNGWHELMRLDVRGGQALQYIFPDGFSAHWIRFKSETNCVVTTTLIYR